MTWDVLVDDFDADGWPDVLYANHKTEHGGDYDHPSIVYWGSESGPSDADTTDLSTHAAAGACSGDLNADGFPDVVITEIEWFDGSETGDKATIFFGGEAGLSDGDAMTVPAVGAAGCSIHDLDLDGFEDLIVGNLCDGTTYDIDSIIYWGSETGIDIEISSVLPTNGAYSVVTHPLEDGY
jgi:hypothetical protein